MLREPKAGWTNIYFGNEYLGCASYITDVPIDLLNAFISYFSQKEKYLGFHVEFDAEGYIFGIIQFNNILYEIDTATDSYIPNLKELDPKLLGLESYSNADEVLLCLAKEVIFDINNYLELWVSWEADEFMSKEEKEKRKNELEEKSFILEKLIKK